MRYVSLYYRQFRPGSGNTEISYLHFTVFSKQKIIRFDILVDEFLFVGVMQPPGKLYGNVQKALLLFLPGSPV